MLYSMYIGLSSSVNFSDLFGFFFQCMKFNYKKIRACTDHVYKIGMNVSLRILVNEKNHTRLYVRKNTIYSNKHAWCRSGLASENTYTSNRLSISTNLLKELIWTCILRWKIIYHNARTHEHTPLTEQCFSTHTCTLI